MSRLDKTTQINEAEILELTKKHVLFTWAIQGKHTPRVIVKGEGCHFWDVKGKKFLDFTSQANCLIAGFNNKNIINAIKSQLDVLPFVASSHATLVKAKFCKLVAEITPKNLVKTCIFSGGAEAVEHAVKIARAYKKRQKIVARYRSYHGATYGAITLTSDIRRSYIEPGISGVVRAFQPYCYRCPFGHEYPKCNIECAEHVRELILEENPETVAAMIVETVSGGTGVIIPPPEYYPRLKEIINEFGILLICDEVMTGYGRTGKWFACEHWNLEPDMLVAGKGAGGGYLPLSYVVISEEISDYFEDNRLYVGTTFSGHPVLCAAGIGTINVCKEEDLIGNSNRLGKVLVRRLEEMKEKHQCVGDVRGLGLFAVLELVKDRETKEPIVPWYTRDFSQVEGIMMKLQSEMLEKGLILYIRRNIIRVKPPLCITESELMHGLNIVDEVLDIADQYIKK